MANAKNQINKKAIQKSLEAGTTDRAEQDIVLARKEEEAIAQMIKDFRRQERKKARPKTRVL